MKRWLVAFGLTIIFLSGCGGSGDGNDTDTPSVEKDSQTFETSEISIQFPKGWEIITAKDFTSEVPVGTIVGFRSPIKNETFTTNFSVLRNELPEKVETMDYAKGLLQKQSSSLIDFQELGREEVKIKVGAQATKTLMTHFQGKEMADADAKEFFQISAVKEKTAYIATAAFLLSEDEGMKKVVRSALQSLVIK